ncbi:MAG: hypothetical protein QOJ79_991 [Actinomycetota bacterium]|jgi:hypothetical protein|nr:hypothetical protein [Actinomycetota bacterium]
MIVELRQYTLVPGKRDILVDVFDREFVESQEALGMQILGTFRDLDREDRFVWLRAFADMKNRLAGLTSFYSGPVWKEHGPLANTTMVSVDDVLLLHPVTGLVLPAARDVSTADTELVITVHDRELLPQLDPGLGLLETDSAVNDFPALPVREGVDVAVRLGRAVPPVPAQQVLRLAPTPRSLLR